MKYLLLLVFLVSCSVKDKADIPPPQLVEQGNLPSNVQWTAGKGFLIRVDKDAATFTVGTMTATYYVVDASLVPPEDAKLEVTYLMPEMPEMPVVPAVVEQVSPGLFQVTYDISMGGLWKIDLKFSGAGKKNETLSLPEFTVPE